MTPQEIAQIAEKVVEENSSRGDKTARTVGGVSISSILVLLLLNQFFPQLNAATNAASDAVDEKIQAVASEIEETVMEKVKAQGDALSIQIKAVEDSQKIIKNAQTELVVEQRVMAEHIGGIEEEITKLNKRLDRDDKDERLDALIRALNKRLEE